MSSYLSPQFKYMIFHKLIYILNLLQVYYEQCDQLPIDGLIAQLVEHCTGTAEAMSSNPVLALISQLP